MKTFQGLQFISDNSEFNKSEKSMMKTEENIAEKVLSENVSVPRRRVHRSYALGISLAQEII